MNQIMSRNTRGERMTLGVSAGGNCVPLSEQFSKRGYCLLGPEMQEQILAKADAEALVQAAAHAHYAPVDSTPQPHFGKGQFSRESRVHLDECHRVLQQIQTSPLAGALFPDSPVPLTVGRTDIIMLKPNDFLQFGLNTAFLGLGCELVIPVSGMKDTSRLAVLVSEAPLVVEQVPALGDTPQFINTLT